MCAVCKSHRSQFSAHRARQLHARALRLRELLNRPGSDLELQKFHGGEMRLHLLQREVRAPLTPVSEARLGSIRKREGLLGVQVDADEPGKAFVAGKMLLAAVSFTKPKPKSLNALCT